MKQGRRRGGGGGGGGGDWGGVYDQLTDNVIKALARLPGGVGGEGEEQETANQLHHWYHRLVRCIVTSMKAGHTHLLQPLKEEPQHWRGRREARQAGHTL